MDCRAPRCRHGADCCQRRMPHGSHANCREGFPMRIERFCKAALTAVLLWSTVALACPDAPPRGTGDLGLVVERAAGSLQLIETSGRTALARIPGLGDLSHASLVYSRDGRYAYVFGRDGGLTKVDLLCATIERRVLQAGNSIGGAISQDGRLVATENYSPGGVKVFSADTLELLADIPSEYEPGRRAKVVGLADAPGNRFVFSLFEAGEIWVANLSDPRHPLIERCRNAGNQPYDALSTP